MKHCLSLMFVFLVKLSVGQTNLEQFLAHPTESNFTASLDGKNIAWTINDAGKRNVMIKTGTEIPRMLTDYQQDDGQEIAQLEFSPNGTKWLFVGGGEGNHKAT